MIKQKWLEELLSLEGTAVEEVINELAYTLFLSLARRLLQQVRTDVIPLLPQILK